MASYLLKRPVSALALIGCVDQIDQSGVWGMVAYEFYWRDKTEGDRLIGILPERRKDPERITKESVMKWVRMVLGDLVDNNRIYFVQVEVKNQGP